MLIFSIVIFYFLLIHCVIGDGEGMGSLHYAAIFDRAACINALVSTSKEKLLIDAQVS